MIELIVQYILTFALGGFGGFLGAYAMYKIAKKDMISEANAYIKTDEGVKMLYTIGALIGNGLKDGFGLTKRGGKMKWEDLAIQIGAAAAQKYLPGLFGGGEQAQPAEQEKKTPF